MSDELKQQNNDSVQDVMVDWEARAQEYLDNWKHATADLINYKKDEEKRISELLKFGNSALMIEFLDVADMVDVAMAHAPPNLNEEQTEWFKGVERIASGIRELLKRHGVERIESVGRDFDPSVHEAMQQSEDKPEDSGKVIQELRAGYTLHERVIRPARVKVGK